jgi:hypothetical protein
MRQNGSSALYKMQQDYADIGDLRVNFQRTCRVPEGKLNSLPAGLGSFPVFRVSDFRSGAPKEWRDDGFFMPMYRQEAMWISFRRGYQKNPKAVIVGAGNINAVSGKPFDPSKAKDAEKREGSEGELDIKLEKEQNYLVVPPQPWLDGWKAEDGKIYQFVAAEMGSGETVEGQITGEEKAGGIQLIVYDPKPGQELVHATRPHEYLEGGSFGGLKGGGITFEDGGAEVFCLGVSKGVSSRGATRGGPRPAARGPRPVARSMGLGRGGSIEQKIYPDPHGLEVWNPTPTAVDIVYLVSSEDFRQVTGHEAPPTPVTYAKYQQLGLPWFGLHDTKLEDAKGSDVFAKLKPVGEGKKK